MPELTITQFMHPKGTRSECTLEVSQELYDMALNQNISCEMMLHDYTKVVFSSHKKGSDPEEEQCMIAENNEGPNSPAKTLEKLIIKVDMYVKCKNCNGEGRFLSSNLTLDTISCPVCCEYNPGMECFPDFMRDGKCTATKCKFKN